MTKHAHAAGAQHSSFRIFGFSVFLTIASLVAVLLGKGLAALMTTAILIVVEVAFSFDNAVINARLLARLSSFWQKMFLTVGVLIAVLGMRIVFPILIVSLTAHLSWGEVLNLAFHHPSEYAHELEHAHTSIAAFGGAFLLMLALHFFFDDVREVLWLRRIEKHFQKLAKGWVPALITALVIGVMAILPINHDKSATLYAGALGIIVYSLMQLVTIGMEKFRKAEIKGDGKQRGVAALVTFLYLEVLDASFSFDGVIGAFAITNEVVLIAVGLGVGAMWVRSLTVFMVKRQTLGKYLYLEHGAHYAILILALLLLVSLLVAIPDLVAGLAGILLIGASIIASKKALV